METQRADSFAFFLVRKEGKKYESINSDWLKSVFHGEKTL